MCMTAGHWNLIVQTGRSTAQPEFTFLFYNKCKVELHKVK